MVAATTTEAPLKILGICASPRANSNTGIMLATALEGAQSAGQVEISQFDFRNKRILPCVHCGACKKTHRCIQNDDFGDLFDLWLDADAVLYATPVYQMGITGQFKCALDRLGHVLYSTYNRVIPRFLKVGGAIAQGNSRCGGQELAIAYLTQHILAMNCIPVSGDTPDSYVGAGGIVPNREKGGIILDETGLSAARSLGQRVAEVASIIRAGLGILKDSLPPEYEVRKANQ